MLDAEEVRTFVQGTVHFFETATGHPATVGSPYLCIDKSAVVQDYAGVIGISGNREGKVYFTAPRGTPTICDKTNAATAAATNGRSFVIPINWRSYAANVVVCLQ